jgi:chromosome segregation ATPase
MELTWTTTGLDNTASRCRELKSELGKTFAELLALKAQTANTQIASPAANEELAELREELAHAHAAKDNAVDTRDRAIQELDGSRQEPAAL